MGSCPYEEDWRFLALMKLFLKLLKKSLKEKLPDVRRNADGTA